MDLFLRIQRLTNTTTIHIGLWEDNEMGCGLMGSTQNKTPLLHEFFSVLASFIKAQEDSIRFWTLISMVMDETAERKKYEGFILNNRIDQPQTSVRRDVFGRYEDGRLEVGWAVWKELAIPDHH